jgi:26S proteasome non-ATPase regulatory subunit 10
MDEQQSLPVHDAARDGKSLLLQSLLQHDPQGVNKKDQDGRTPLFWAISTGGPEASSVILKFIREHKPKNFDIDETDDSGWTALHLAASTGNLSVIDQLYQMVPDVNAQTTRGQTALHFATSKGHIDVVRSLLDHGASPRTKDSLNQTPLHRAAAIGSLPILKILVAAKCPINATDRSSWTALHHAYAEGHGDVAVELLHAGADPDRTDAEGLTPEEVAVDDKVKKFVTANS